MNGTRVASPHGPKKPTVSTEGDEMQASRKKTSSDGSSGRRSEEAKRHKSEEAVEDESSENSHKEEDDASFEMPQDESQLSDEEKVGRLNDLYERHIRQPWLAIALWVIVNVLKNNLEAARSKNPRKDDSFNKIANSQDLHPDLRGPVLRRWVAAGAAWQELANAGVDTDTITYSHCREIAKLPTLKSRISMGERVVAESLTVKETIEAVQEENAKGKPEASSSDSDLCGLARAVIEKLDDPVALSEDEDFCDVLLDSAQVRAEFNFREQSKIYDKAEKIKKQEIREKSDLEHRLEGLQQSINFLEDLMNTFDGKEEDAKTAA